MSTHRPLNATWMMQRLAYAKGPYGAANRFAMEVQKVYRGDYRVPSDLDGTTVEVVRPSRGYTLVQKYLSMLSIRSRKSISVAQHARTETEERKVDKIERGLQAYLDDIAYHTQRDPLHDAAFWAFLRGRGDFITVYDPLKAGIKIPLRTPDPLTIFPVMGDYGVDWFMQETWRPRLQLTDFFERFNRSEIKVPQLGKADEVDPLSDYVHVVEYWDEKWHAMLLNDQFYGPFEKDYGCVPLTEIRINSTPEDEQRWNNMSLLGAVLEDLKQYNVLLSKMATGVDQFFYPRMYYMTETGQMMMIDPNAPPGEFIPIAPGTQPIILDPSPDHNTLNLYKNEIERNITNGTLPEVVFVQDIPNASGFLVSQMLSIVQDAIADKRDALERGYGRALGMVLRLMERFADAQDNGAWQLPIRDNYGKRKYMEQLTADDIDGHYHVTVSIMPALPQDKIQMTTIYNQLGEIDQATGRPSFSRRVRRDLAGLTDVIEDVSAMEDDIEWEWLVATDKETQQLAKDVAKARNSKRIQALQKEVDAAQRRDQRSAEKQANREFDQAANRPLVIPAERKQDAQFLKQLAAAVEQGFDPESALNSGMQFGMPDQQQQGQQGQQPDQSQPDVSDLMSMLQQAQPPAQQGTEAPNGLTGYDNGLSPTVAPAAMQGAIPRNNQTDPSLQIEQAQTFARRGALPPAK
jgi:hypothetical protein